MLQPSRSGSRALALNVAVTAGGFRGGVTQHPTTPVHWVTLGGPGEDTLDVIFRPSLKCLRVCIPTHQVSPLILPLSLSLCLSVSLSLSLSPCITIPMMHHRVGRRGRGHTLVARDWISDFCVWALSVEDMELIWPCMAFFRLSRHRHWERKRRSKKA